MNYADNEEHYDAMGHDPNHTTEANTPQTQTQTQTLFHGVPLSQENSMEAITLLTQQLEEMKALHTAQTQEIAAMRATASNHYSFAYPPPPHIPATSIAPTRPGRIRLPGLPVYSGDRAGFAS
jgi:hypothetical protein